MKTVFFTGRRPKDLCGYNYDGYVDFVHSLTDIILDFYKQGFGQFISGGAQGFDQLAFLGSPQRKKAMFGYSEHRLCAIPRTVPQMGADRSVQ